MHRSHLVLACGFRSDEGQSQRALLQASCCRSHTHPPLLLPKPGGFKACSAGRDHYYSSPMTPAPVSLRSAASSVTVVCLTFTRSLTPATHTEMICSVLSCLGFVRLQLPILRVACVGGSWSMEPPGVQVFM